MQVPRFIWHAVSTNHKLNEMNVRAMVTSQHCNLASGELFD